MTRGQKAEISALREQINILTAEPSEVRAKNKAEAPPNTATLATNATQEGWDRSSSHSRI